MSIVVIRTVILYFTVLFAIRIMGKSELSKMSPFQMVIIFMIAELAAIPIESPQVSLLTGVLAILSLLFLQVLISFISLKSESFRLFVSGRPSVLIDRGKINIKEMKRLRISVSDLMEQLRIGNAPSLGDVEYAVLESNGSLSIILKPEKNPVTPSDMNMASGDSYLPVTVISDGILYRSVLKKKGISEKKLLKELSSHNLSLPEVFLAYYDEKETLHVFRRQYNTAKEV